MNFKGIVLLACLTPSFACETEYGRRLGVGDACVRDRDCDDCAHAPVCINIDPKTKKGKCGLPSPTSTPAPIQQAPGSGGECCAQPRTVPSDCEVDILIDLLDIAIASDHKLAAQWLRLAFHDAGTFHKGQGVGGANGCLMTDSRFRDEAENGFLDLPIDALDVVRANWEVHKDTCIDVSAADMIQFAGFFAATRQTAPIGVDTTLKRNVLKDFKWGRFDETSCKISWVRNLPGFQLGAPENNIPMRCVAAGSEIKLKMMDRNGFTAEEACALIGAHTIGLTRNTFETDLANPWVPNGDDHATVDGPIFDNAFHHFLTNGLAAESAIEMATNQLPFNKIFPDWYQDEVKEMNFLDTDIVLAYKPASSSNVHPDFHTFTDAFAANNTLFLNKFFLALDKMSQLGVDEVLAFPSPCTACSGTGKINTDSLSMFVDNLGTATALAEKDLREKQHSAEFKVPREKDITPVKVNTILDATASEKEIMKALEGAKTPEEKQAALEKLKQMKSQKMP